MLVEMKNGQKIDFGMRKKVIKTVKATSADSFEVTMDFANGETHVFNVTRDQFIQYAMFGALQILGDTFTANSENIEKGIAAVLAKFEMISRGEWELEKTETPKVGSMLAQALVNVYKLDPQKVIDFLKTKSSEEKSALSLTPELKPEIDRLKAEKTVKKLGQVVDTSSLLSGLMN